MMAFPYLGGVPFIIQYFKNFMSKTTLKQAPQPKSRKSLTIDTLLLERLSDLQGRLIQTTHNNWSVSSLVTILTLAGLMHSNKINQNEWNKILTMVKKKNITVEDKQLRNCISKIAAV